MHANTHVFYEAGQHEVGLAWLDHWVSASGRGASHRAHFSWHAALHELALGDVEAVRRRYYSQLAPPVVTGVRALIDSASLLWRWRVMMSGIDSRDVPPLATVLDHVDADMLTAPTTPFVALHSAIAHAGVGDVAALNALANHCRQSRDPAMRATVTATCDALGAVVEERYGDAAVVLTDAMPRLSRLGGSAAQREVLEETLLMCLLRGEQVEGARRLLDGRLERRPSPHDLRRRESLTAPPPAGQGAG